MSDKIQNIIMTILISYILGLIIFELYNNIVLLQFAVLMPLILLIIAVIMHEFKTLKR